MSTPRPLPPFDAAHVQHDVVLIAQLAAGDPLEPAQATEAHRLVASCRGCAELAADLRAVSGAVAWEPLPPRRRDFRIDAARAEQLRGSAWSRLQRRFSLPQGRALRPAAAGVMSLGLVLVVAGSVWPGTDSASQVQPAAVPQPSALVEERPASVGSTPGALAPAELMTIDMSADAGVMSDDAPAAGAAPPSLGREAPAPELYASSSKASSAPSRERDTAHEERIDAAAEGATGGSTSDDGSLLAPMASSGALGTGAELAADAMAAEAFEMAAPSGAAEQGLVADTTAGQMAEPMLEDETVAGTDPGNATSSDVDAVMVATTGGDALDIESVLLWVGAGLALIGAAVLLLGWLSRRATDPLLR